MLPLVGDINVSSVRWGPRFPNLSGIYSITLREKIVQVAENLGMALREGIFVAISGLSLEIPAETTASAAPCKRSQFGGLRKTGVVIP